MRQDVVNNIIDLKHRSVGPLRDQQIAYIPRYEDDMIEFQTTEYLLNGNRQLINQRTQACFKLRYLHTYYMEPRVYVDFNQHIHYMIDVVEEGKVKPFMIFINGKFVLWHMIQIVATQESNYLIITAENEDWIYHLHHVDTINVIMLPDNVKYVNMPLSVATIMSITEDHSGPIFSFNTQGLLDTVTPSVSFRKTSSKLLCTDYIQNAPVDALIVDTDTTHKYYKENVVVFDESGRLYPDADVSVTSTMVSIKTDEERQNNLQFKVFFCLNANTSADNIRKASVDYIQPVEQAYNAGDPYPEYMQKLVEAFEVAMDRNKNYSENFLEAIQKIISYDPALFSEAFSANSNLRIETLDGAYVLDHTDSSGIMTIPRKHNEMVDEYILILVNGELYRYTYNVTYYASSCAIPISGIVASDTIEILHLENVNNNIYNITVKETDGFMPYSKQIINDTMILFSTVPHNSTYEYPADGLQHFPVPYTLEEDEDGYIHITLNDSFYYGKPLKIAYQNQFRQFRFYLSEEVSDSIRIDLKDKFMYCNDYTKYMVFYNGRRLTSDQFRLTLPVREGTPFYDFRLYITIPLEANTNIDVLYLPSLMTDVYATEDLPQSGDIVVDKSVLGYPLLTELYILWLNGKKVPANAISDMDSTHFRVTTDQKTLHSVALTKFIPDDEDLTLAYKNSSPSLWDSITALFIDNYDELAALLGIEADTLTDTEPEVYSGAVPVESIMWELIRENFISGANVDTSKPFVYDYLDVDQSAIVGTDSGDNALLGAADANRTDNLDIERYYP